MLKQVRDEFKVQEDTMRSDIVFLQKRLRHAQDRLRKIYGPRLSFALPPKESRWAQWNGGHRALSWVGASGGPTSYGTVGNDPVLLSGMDRWDAWLREAAQDNTSYLNASNDHEHEYLNRPASHRGLLDTPRFGGAALRDKDPLMVLVEDAVAQVQSQCPFRVRLRPVPHSTSNSPRDACLYFMADRKLCMRLENGIAMCLFATHTEPLKEYLENLYSVFTTMPAEAILLRFRNAGRCKWCRTK